MVLGTQSRNSGVIVLSLIVAIIMMLIPLPDSVRFARPEWVILTLIYWAMALPERVGIGVAWVTGLIMDVVMGSTLGVQAFAYALAIYLVARFHLQLRQYPLWQQAFIILSLVFLVHLISELAYAESINWHMWLSVPTSTLVWPLVYAVLRKIRRSFQVS